MSNSWRWDYSIFCGLGLLACLALGDSAAQAASAPTTAKCAAARHDAVPSLDGADAQSHAQFRSELGQNRAAYVKAGCGSAASFAAVICPRLSETLNTDSDDLQREDDPRDLQQDRQTVAGDRFQLATAGCTGLTGPDKSQASAGAAHASALPPAAAAELSRRLREVDALQDKFSEVKGIQWSLKDPALAAELAKRRDLIAWEKATPGVPPAIVFDEQLALAGGEGLSRGSLTDVMDPFNATRDERISLLVEVLAKTKDESTYAPEAYDALKALAEIYSSANDNARAAAYYRDLLKYSDLITADRNGAQLLSWAANSFDLAGLDDLALQTFRLGLDAYRKTYRDALAAQAEADPNDPTDNGDEELFSAWQMLDGALSLLAGRLDQAGKTADALPLFEEQSAITTQTRRVLAKAKRDPDTRSNQDGIMVTYVSRDAESAGEAYLSAGQPDKAIPLLQHELEDDHATGLGQMGYSRQHAEEMLGRAYFYKLDYASAQRAFRASLADWIGSPDPAALLDRIRDRDKIIAAEKAKQSDSIMAAMMPSTVVVNLIYAREEIDHLVETLLAAKDYQGAEQMAQLQVQAAQAQFKGETDASEMSLHRLAEVYIKEGHLADAEKTLDHEARVLREQPDLWMAANSDNKNGVNAAGPIADLSPAIFTGYLDVAWRLLPASPDQQQRLSQNAYLVMQDTLNANAAVAMAMAASRAAAGSGPLAAAVNEQQQLLARVRTLRAQASGSLSAGAGGQSIDLLGELDKANARLAEINTTLAKSFPAYSAMVSPAPLSYDETAKALAPDEGLLLIVPVGDDVYSFATGPGGSAWHRMDGGAKGIAAVTDILRCEVDPGNCPAGSDPHTPSPAEAKGSARYDLNAAYKLYASLVAPVESALAGAKRLYVTTSGPLAQVPLAMLVTKAPDATADLADPAVLAGAQWLSNRYATTYLPAPASLRLRALAPVGKANPSDAPFDGYGDPRLEGNSTEKLRGAKIFTVALRGSTLADPALLRQAPPLPGTRIELTNMASSLGAAADEVHILDQATETAVKQDPALRTARVIAFATHGILPDPSQSLAEPGLILTPPQIASELDDGLLTASEASQLTLTADWVILSACNTATVAGSSGSDSLSSLARGFLYAGAQALLASHWSISDEGTAALTVETLRLRREHPQMTRSVALQGAMMALRTGHRDNGSAIAGWQPIWAHPAIWSPFTVISDHDD